MSESIPSSPASPGPGAEPGNRGRGSRRRLWLIVPAVMLFMSVYVGGHAYLAHRLVIAPGWPAPLASLLLFGLGLLALLMFLQPLAERFFPARVEKIIVWPASIWMGIAFLLLMALWLADLALLLMGAAGGVEPQLAARFRAVAVIALVLPAALLGLRRGLSLPKVKRVEIDLSGWPQALDGFRIAQISDIHFGPILGRPFAAYLRDEVNALEPDLIAVTGDLVDGPVHKVRDEVEPLADLEAPLGTWFVTGNHDHYSGAESWVDRVGELGMTVLRNEHVVLDYRGASFVLAGVDDHRSRQMPGEGGEDLDAALDGIDSGSPVVLLAHDPTTFRKARDREVALQLSGHTHGGQIWPFKYFVRMAMPWVAGLYRERGSAVYVSRGTGFWGPPMRLGAPAEITELILRAAPVQVARAT